MFHISIASSINDDINNVIKYTYYTRNHYHYLIRGIKKNGDLAVRRSLSKSLLRDPSRDYWTEVKKIHKNKFRIQNRVDDKRVV